AVPGTPSAETCDGIDNDCDGAADNGFTLGEACSAGTGACQAAGVTVCSGDGSATRCNAVPGTPSAETCDGLDNDCDGAADNGFTLGEACSVGTGACQAAGVTVCSGDGTATMCNAVPGTPSAETCDGLDNDCDGASDNGFTLGEACSAGTGACQAAGVTVCSGTGTGTTCNAVPGTPSAETCDGLDNDCDGAADNGFTLGEVCSAGTGACQAPGITVCSGDGSATMCNAVPGTPSAETCDGLDNDCNGTTDNGFTLGETCSAGVGACQAAGVTVCSGDGAGTTCNAVPGTPSAETCDGLDNDCNGTIDNGFVLGASCTAGTGACEAAGVTVCSGDGSGTMCSAVPGTPSTETCDGLDNDCDGTTDNAAVPTGLADDLTVTHSGGVTQISWNAIPGATAYDLVKGSLLNLHSSHGDFRTSTNVCVANNTAATSVQHPIGPAPGAGFYYLVRPLNCGGNGTYDSLDPSQVGLRNAEVIASTQCQ
ncbi:MAG: MopE-related protein, partial [Candidatus Polarisedimenticolia bacterium]